MPYIRYVTKGGGAEYASLVSSERSGNKVTQKYLENLGRVVDKERNVFQNKERGVFCYTSEDGFSDVLLSQKTPQNEKLILDFGDSHFLFEYLKTTPFFQVFADILPLKKDKLFSLLFFKILTDKKACCYADIWWSGNYASILFPKADLKSQRISEFFEALGSEEVQRKFFGEYIFKLYGKYGTTGILIDSSGIPNVSKMAVTQISNHNGDINMEARLIYVLDRKSGMPIYFRYCPGNIIDVTTLCTTIAELKQYDISIDYAIMDAGYFSEDNIKSLFQEKIQFITRLAPNRVLFKQLVNENLFGLNSSKYAIKYGNRLVYIKKTQIDLFKNNSYAYIGIDLDSRNQQMKRNAFISIEDKLSVEEADARMAKLGVFVLVSSVDIDTDEILPLYYTRQQIEQVFDIGKNGADMLPIRVQKEKTFRGHLMLTFLATILLQSLQKNIISKRKKKDKINAEGIFITMKNQKCKVFDKEIIPQEPVKLINEIYKLFKITSPITLPKNVV